MNEYITDPLFILYPRRETKTAPFNDGSLYCTRADFGILYAS